MKKILVLNGPSYGRAITGQGELKTSAGDFLRNPEQYSLVLFTGGEDVSPDLYGETSPMRICGSNKHRDVFEGKVLSVAQVHGIPCAGICRGIQFLNVMSGGRMMHHLDGHGGTKHDVVNTVGAPVLANSYHHQMILPAADAIVVGVAEHKMSAEYIGNMDEAVEYTGPEIEAAIFPATKCFGVQWHPEMMSPDSDGYRFFFDMVSNALCMDWDKFVTLYDGELKYEDTGGETGGDLVMHGLA